MDNPAYHPDPSSGVDAETKHSEVFTISHGSLSGAKRNNPSDIRDHLVPINSKASLFKKPKLYKTTTIILGVFCALLLITLAVLIILYLTGKAFSHTYCNTDECLRSAANLKYSLDLSVDPCEDFYKYTCGHWSEEHPNHGWYTSFSSFAAAGERILIESFNFLTSDSDNDTLPVRQARMLYKSCIDQESTDELGYSVIFSYLEKVGLPKVPSLLLPLTDDEKENFHLNWLEVETKIKKVFSKDVFFGFLVDVSSYNVSQNVMYIGSPGNQCPLPSPFLKQKEEKVVADSDDTLSSEKKKELKNITRKKIVKLVLKLLFQNTTSEVPSEDILEQAAFIIDNVTNTIDELTDNYTASRESMPKSIKIQELQDAINLFTKDAINKEMPEFLEKYLNLMFTDIENVTLDLKQDLLYIAEVERIYINHVMTYLLDTSEIYIELYLWWNTVLELVMNTTSEMVEKIEKLTSVLYESSETNSRSKSVECVDLVNKFMGIAVTYGIADRKFANESGLKVKNMLDNIREAFRKSVEELTWMDRETKIATLEKSKSMYSFIGFPEWLFEKGKIEEYYENIEMTDTTFLQNMMVLLEREMPRQLNKLRVKNEKEFSANPTEVNAYNSFSDNSIIVPLAFLTYPMYHLGLEVLNYGSVGTVLGHELTHGFDNNGRKHDKFGNYKQWWSNETIETFIDKAGCFALQYENITIEGVDGRVSGLRTLGENIADNGGLSHAFKAYQTYKKKHGTENLLPGFENYTDNQLFFIAFGSIWCETALPGDIEDQLQSDVHCPNTVRVNVAVSNSENFAKAFHCQKGSKMNPSERCKIW